MLARSIRTVRQSPFIKNNLIFFTGSLAVAALNYLFYPILGRLMKPADFGEVQTLLSLFIQAGVFLSILNYVTIHVTVNSKNVVERNRTLLGLERLAIFTSYTALIVALFLTPIMKDFLNFTDIWPFLALILALAVSVPLIFRMAFLRGTKLYGKATFTDGIGSFTKIIFAVILVMIGWKSFGAIIGLALSQVVSLYFGLHWAHKAGFVGTGLHSENVDLKTLKPQLGYGLGVFLASSCITLVLGLDIITVKHYFTPETAGLFAGISTISRIVFYVTAPFIGVMVTMVSLNQDAKKNLLQLRGTIGLITAVGGLVWAMIAIFPEFFIRVLVGSKYLAFSDYLPRLSLVMLMLSIGNALLMYQMAMKRYRVAIFASFMVVLTVILVYLYHSTVLDVIDDLLLGSTGILGVAAGYTFYSARKNG